MSQPDLLVLYTVVFSKYRPLVTKSLCSRDIWHVFSGYISLLSLVWGGVLEDKGQRGDGAKELEEPPSKGLQLSPHTTTNCKDFFVIFYCPFLPNNVFAPPPQLCYCLLQMSHGHRSLFPTQFMKSPAWSIFWKFLSETQLNFVLQKLPLLKHWRQCQFVRWPSFPWPFYRVSLLSKPLASLHL